MFESFAYLKFSRYSLGILPSTLVSHRYHNANNTLMSIYM